jgi:hypothetical protein
MLFDLQSDPHQTRNLAENRESKVATMESMLTVWEQQNLAATGLPDPMRLIQNEAPCIIGTPQTYLQRLDTAGRRADAERLRQQYARVSEEYGWREV